MKKLFSLLVVTFFAKSIFAWGGHGHDAICQAAVYLVENKNLADFLKSRPHVMGHLCNLPDTYWRSLDRKLTMLGDPSHYVNPELLGINVSDIPLDLKELLEKNKKSSEFLLELGTNWWRAEQFVQRAIDFGQLAKKSELPSNSKQEQDYELPYNRSVFSMFASMGLLGHFVGDNSQPFHNTSDYDGWAANQGGIHSYYEEASVSRLGPELMIKIIDRAKRLKKTPFLNGKSAAEKMQKLAIISVSEIKDVLKADPIIKNSLLKIEKGMQLKTRAERQPPEVGAKKFEKMIIEQMSRSARLLAHFWDDIYSKAGEPDLKTYRSYQFPHTVDFVNPDYLEPKNKL